MMLETPRLVLLSPEEASAEAVARYYCANRAFLNLWEPEREDAFYTVEHQRALLRAQALAWREDRSYRCYIVRREDRGTIIGLAALNNIVRCSFQSCFIGYNLMREWTGRGLMSEAVARLVRFAFDELRLHRIEGNALPENAASIAVLRRNGFECEGRSPKYLRLNGEWRDYVHYVIRNIEME